MKTLEEKKKVQKITAQRLPKKDYGTYIVFTVESALKSKNYMYDFENGVATAIQEAIKRDFPETKDYVLAEAWHNMCNRWEKVSKAKTVVYAGMIIRGDTI